MQHEEGIFKGFGAVDLAFQNWKPDGPVRAILVIVHGFGEHIGRYANVVEGLVPRGYAVWGFDQRGHGNSAGQRGHIGAWREYREDLANFVRYVSANEKNRNLFLLGHSLGSLIAQDYVLHYPDGLRGCILSSILFEPVGAAKPVFVAAAKMLSSVLPTFPLDLRLETSALSRNKDVVEAHERDPLVHHKATPRFATESLKTIEWVKAHSPEWKVPVLILHGDSDRINAPHGSQAFYDMVRIPEKEMRLYSGGYHESHNDLEYPRVASDMDAWMSRYM
ncbi:MAG TPA: lysophospholipase [Anaerolineales bacterium]|nr:lysophospholipase [Anaerolineales bacterium]